MYRAYAANTSRGTRPEPCRYRRPPCCPSKTWMRRARKPSATGRPGPDRAGGRDGRMKASQRLAPPSLARARGKGYGLFRRRNRSLTDRREYLSVRFAPDDELHRGGHMVIAGDAHDQHDDAAWQAARIERGAWQVIGRLESGHAYNDCKDIAHDWRRKRVCSRTSRQVWAGRAANRARKGRRSVPFIDRRRRRSRRGWQA